MYAIVLTTILLGLASALALQAGQNFELMHLFQAQAQRTQLVKLAENLEQYYVEQGQYPVDLGALAHSAGYEHVRSLLNNWQGYQRSDVLDDGVWQYRRMVAFSVDRSRGMDDTAFLAAASNGCGVGAFADASSWCGPRHGIWFRRETREMTNDAVSTQRARLRRSLQKFGDFYSDQERFPNVDANGVALVAGRTYRLAELAGYDGSASSCQGIYRWRGMPIGCEDMFDAWGGAIGLAYQSDQSVTLISETPLVNAAGVPLVVASGFTM